jgi:hypothetical protein
MIKLNVGQIYLWTRDLFSEEAQKNAYYLLILSEKYGIMSVYHSKTMGIMATFPHDR